MFDWLFGNRQKKLEEETKRGFSAVKDDIESVGKWIKHLDGKDKQLFELISELKSDLSTVKEDLGSVRETLDLFNNGLENKQVFKKLPVFEKQTAVLGVEKSVQTAVQSGDLYDILKGLSSNEKRMVMTLMDSDMKLSFEDLALVLGKEKSTVRGQVNSIRQKAEGLIEEIVEKNGKKRVFIPERIKEKLAKYAKVGTGKKKRKA